MPLAYSDELSTTQTHTNTINANKTR